MVAVSCAWWRPAMSTHIFQFWFIIAGYSVFVTSPNIVRQIVFYAFTCNSCFKRVIMNVIQGSFKSVAIFPYPQTGFFQICRIFQKWCKKGLCFHKSAATPDTGLTCPCFFDSLF